MNNQEKRCGNCKYFAWHYFKYKEKLLKADCGNCVNPACSVSTGKKCGNGNYVCGLWESYDVAVSGQRERIEKKLLQIAAQLGDIALILKDEKGEGKN